MTAPFALTDRALVRLTGSDCEGLLQRLITTNLDNLALDQAGYGALLTPQGKILMDFLVIRQEDGFLFDLDRSQQEAFAKKMILYRLRSDVGIEMLAAPVALSFEKREDAIADPRDARLGWRLYGAAHPQDVTDEAELNCRFVAAAIPRAGLDFPFGDAFPHDANFDDLGGIDFEKGCYVGQEVVSRMKHRGTARKRLVHVEAEGNMPEPGTAVTIEGKSIGTLGAVAGTQGLAILRLDHVADALKNGGQIMAGGHAVTVQLPDYASFALPSA